MLRGVWGITRESYIESAWSCLTKELRTNGQTHTVSCVLSKDRDIYSWANLRANLGLKWPTRLASRRYSRRSTNNNLRSKIFWNCPCRNSLCTQQLTEKLDNHDWKTIVSSTVKTMSVCRVVDAIFRKIEINYLKHFLWNNSSHVRSTGNLIYIFSRVLRAFMGTSQSVETLNSGNMLNFQML